MRKPVRVLFDETHGQAWTIRREVAATIQPSHPGDASYACAADATAHDHERSDRSPRWAPADLDRRRRSVDVPARVTDVCLDRATTLDAPADTVLARAGATSSAPGAALLAGPAHGQGRVVVLADSNPVGDDSLREHEHEALWLDLLYWVAVPPFAAPAPTAGGGVEASTPWQALRAATAELRLLQASDGSVDLEAHDAARLDALVETMTAAVAGLAPAFPRQAAYLEPAGPGRSPTSRTRGRTSTTSPEGDLGVGPEGLQRRGEVRRPASAAS